MGPMTIRKPRLPASMAIACARLRLPLVWAGIALLVADRFLAIPPALGPVVFLIGMALYLRVGTVRRDPVEVTPPVTGRWLPFNSPATRVPSHGIQAYGQTYAVDLACDPADRQRPQLGWWPPGRRPGDFPGFGRPVLAPADGVVVRTHDRERDHWSRDSWPGLAYLIVEGVLRELLGPGRIFGNHIVLDLGDGVYAVLAHLRRGSVRVTKGQRVTAGEQVAACGNSGNSTEPHLHFQLMDHRSVLLGAGLPVRFDAFEVDGVAASGMPRSGRPFVVPSPPQPEGASPRRSTSSPR